MKPENDKPISIEQARQKIANVMNELLAGNNPGPQSFRLKRTKKASETYPLKLTWHQRDSIIQFTHINPKLKEKLLDASEGTQIVGLTRREMDHLLDEIAKEALYTISPHKKRLLAVMSKITELFAEDRAGLFGEAVSKVRKSAPKKSALIFQFKITLHFVEPPVWRRIQVRDCTLNEFHEYLQAAFGWANCHLHRFEIDGERYSEPDPNGDDYDLEFVDETQILLSNLITNSGRQVHWKYEYDFGDYWQHEVVFEGFPPVDQKGKYPLCLEGAQACPPEDCGGPGGYEEYLDAISDPQHEQHKELLEWRGPFDPEAFDTKLATKEMRKLK